MLTNSLIPINIRYASNYLIYQMLINYIDFWLNYFHFWPSLATSFLTQICFYAARNIFYDDSISEIIVFGIFSIPWHLLNLLFIHLVITKVGMLYAETEVLRVGNEQVLDSLQEGVVILERGTENNDGILYSNKASKGEQDLNLSTE